MGQGGRDGEKRKFSLIEVEEITGLERRTLVTLIHHEWIRPVTEDTLDEEDVARIALIQELRIEFGANDEAIPIILHLIDQLYTLRHQIKCKGP